jgi:hypothetical protein
MGLNDGQRQERRFIVGIGVAQYDDPTLNLKAVPDDVQSITDWFATRTRLQHERVLPELAQSPTFAEISSKLSAWLNACRADDVVVIYIAAHGELYGNTAYILGRDSPRTGMAGQALSGATIGEMIGQARPHNILVIVDACVAGKLGSAIQRKAEDVADELNLRDSHRRYAQAVLCSTFSRDPAHDGLFAKAFLSVVSHERWTGTTRPWIDFDRIMDGLNEELQVLKKPQVAERKVWGTGGADLIPNPNFETRRWSSLIADEELATHFDPASRGVSQNEAGWYFTGRRRELAQLVKWLAKPVAGGKPFVVTGSPGSGKSALVARLFTLSDESRRNALPDLVSVPPETIPPSGSIDAVIWCHNKTTDQVVADLGTRLGLNARTSDELFAALKVEPRRISIIVDALDEAVEGEATKIAANMVQPLAAMPEVKVVVATRPHPVRTKKGGKEESDLLAALAVSPRDANCLVLDKAKDRAADMREYIAARLMASAEPDRVTPYSNDPALARRAAEKIAAAAGNSFLVAAVTARSLALQETAIDVEKLSLPKDAGAALAGYIDRLPNPAAAIDILRPLAWAQGVGLPWGTLWAPIARALAKAVDRESDFLYDDDDVARVLDWASDLIVEAVEDGEPVYRLFHEALAEHLRRDLDSEVAHAEIAFVLDVALGAPSYEKAPPYVLAHLPTHLARTIGNYDRLYELVTDPQWWRAKRLRFGDVTRFLHDLRGVVAGAPLEGFETYLAGVCIVHGRMMAVAPAMVVGVIGRAGQVHRGELMANNIEFAVDRCLAYSLLAPAFAADGDLAAAQRCLSEAERAISAIDTTHSGMAWAWVAKAAVDCRSTEAAARASASALKSVEALRGQEVWEFDNGVFWAAVAARTAGDEQSKQALVAMFTEDQRIPGRNQYLQAASVLGLKDVLRAVWRSVRDDRSATPVRDGNLALALADAGLTEELDELLEMVAVEGAARGEADAQKRYAWALAIVGDLDGALAHVLTIEDEEHRVRALDRIVSIAVDRSRDDILAKAKKMARKLARTSNWRVQALLAPVLFALKETQEAMRLAEEVVRQEIVPSQEMTVAFPPSEDVPPVDTGSRSRLLRLVRRGGKRGRRALRTDVRSLNDAHVLTGIADLIKTGSRDEAEGRLSEIHVPRLRWEAQQMIAESVSDGVEAELFWWKALSEAQMVSEPAVRETVAAYAERISGTAKGKELGDRMLAEVKRINVRWIEAGFAEHYESLRASLRSGPERTRLLEDLMVLKTRKTGRESVPAIDLTWWDRPRVKALAESDGEGKRAFALALMESEPDLAEFDVVVKMIRTSLSAFEQYHALKVIQRLAPTATPNQHRRLLAVLVAERERHITPGSDRELLARQIERAVARRPVLGGDPGLTRV